MKRLTIAIISLLCFTNAFGQNYKALWKEAQTAVERDLPQSALKPLDKIISKSRKAGDNGWLLQATLLRLHLQSEVSPDSAKQVRQAIEQMLRAERQSALCAVERLILARLYAQRFGTRDELNDTAFNYIEAALQPTASLRSYKSSALLPFIMLGQDSKLFGHDLLHVVAPMAFDQLDELQEVDRLRDKCVALRRQKEGEIIRLYRSAGATDAALLATLDSLKREDTPRLTARTYGRNKQYLFLEQLANKCKNCATGIEVYIHMCELLGDKSLRQQCIDWARRGIAAYPDSKRTVVLRQTVERITTPTFSVSLDKSLAYPSEQIKLKISATNLNDMKLDLFKLPYTARQMEDKQWRGDERFIARHTQQAATYSFGHTFPAHADWEIVADSTSICVPQPGIYLLRATSRSAEADYNIIYISSNQIVCLPLPGKRLRLAVVDAKSGSPKPGASVEAVTRFEKNKMTSYETDAEGCVVVPAKANNYNSQFYPVADGDAFCPPANWHNSWFPNGQLHDPQKLTMLYSDRHIYRPGQTVNAAAIRYSRLDDETRIIAGDSVHFSLRDATGKVVDSQAAVTDTYGTAAAMLRIPDNTLTGVFQVTANGKSQSIRVEEYCRPTFKVTLAPVTQAYKAGDTVAISGVATGYNQSTVQNARVSYTVKRSSYWRWWGHDESTVLKAETTTDENGQFSLRVPLTPRQADEESDYDYSWHNYEVFSIVADVTSPDGETESAQARLTTGREPLSFATNWPTLLLKTQQNGNFVFTLVNTTRQPVDGKGSYSITHKGNLVMTGQFEANKTFRLNSLQSLPSGEYTLEARVTDGNDSLLRIEQKFYVFSLDDKRPANCEELGWIYATGNELSTTTPTSIVVGSPRNDVTLFYDLFTPDSLLRHSLLRLDDSNLRFDYIYKESYGDGLTAVFAFVKDGELFCRTVKLQKPAPKKRLSMKWTSFRDRLVPGQNEKWTLHISAPDGSNAKASVVAALFDASLVKFGQSRWKSSLSYTRTLCNPYWYTPQTSAAYLSGSQSLKYVIEPQLSFDRFGTYFPTSYIERALMGFAPGVRIMCKRETLDMAQPVLMSAKANNMAAAEAAIADATASPQTEDIATEEPIDASVLRQDFSETAFFMPQLTTDDSGNATLQFTLPQSLTTWCFRSVAHDKDMNLGSLDTTIVASKQIMLQPNMPRFLRAADNTFLAATLSNRSDKTQTGSIDIQLLDAEAQKVISSRRAKFCLAPGRNDTVSLAFTAPKEPGLYVVRMLAQAAGSSDGEQRYLSVLPTRSRAVESVPFVVRGSGLHNISLGDTLFARGQNSVANRSLTLEYTDNPMWFAIMSLPGMADVQSDNAISLSTAIYATTLSQTIAQSNPDIQKVFCPASGKGLSDSTFLSPLLRNQELKSVALSLTPWLLDEQAEALRRSRLAQLLDTMAVRSRQTDLVRRIKSLQLADGSWSWFKGMDGSWWITLQVCSQMARLSRLTGNTDAHALAMSGLPFLVREMQRQVADMKKAEQRGGRITMLDHSLLVFLQMLPTTGFKPDASAEADIKYLIDKLRATTAGYDMYDKALCALILNANGNHSKADAAMESIMQHTVSSETAGRYFDSPRAHHSWQNFTIPTQVAAIEALANVRPADSLSRDEMLTWLIQQKRSESWDEPLSTVDAVNVLMSEAQKDNGLLSIPSPTQPTSLSIRLADGTQLQPKSPADGGDNVAGYVKAVWSDKALSAVPVVAAVNKQSSRLSWGAVYANYDADDSQIRVSGKELQISRTYLVFADGRWQPVGKGSTLRIGQTVRIRYDLHTSQDAEYVCISDPRPACLEPVNALSGYGFGGITGIGAGYYRAVGNDRTTYFIEHLPKGESRLEVDFKVDRAGLYSAGPCTIQCQYAPEFVGQTAASRLSAK